MAIGGALSSTVPALVCEVSELRVQPHCRSPQRNGASLMLDDIFEHPIWRKIALAWLVLILIGGTLTVLMGGIVILADLFFGPDIPPFGLPVSPYW